MQGRNTPIVATALAVALLSTAGAATASPPVTVSTHRSGAVTAGDTAELTGGLAGPLRVGIGRRNTAYVSQNFAGKLTSVDRDKTATTLLDRPGTEIGGVSTYKGRVYFTESSGGPMSPEDPFVANVSVLGKGGPRVVADLAALETENNYDADNEYGFQDLADDCAAQIPAELAPVALPHGGEVYSHPFATTVSDSGRYVYVADAGANAVFTIDTRRDTVDATVIEPVETILTEELRASLERQGIDLPECVVGARFNSEPVPTDIERGPDGLLYFTSLPGVPEDPTLGSVRSVDPASGDVEVVTSGLTSPTGLAVDRRGNIFVAELFANRISVIAEGTEEAVPFREVTRPADVEIDGRYLYATTNAVPAETAPGAAPAEPQGTLERTRLDYGRR